jgi:Zn-dependent protease
MACVFLSILVHELGHAFAARAFGLPAQITFHLLGGATSFPQVARLSRARDIMISLAGPAAGLLLGIVAWVLAQLYAPAATGSEQVIAPSLFVITLQSLWWLNIAWSFLNLVPVIPFDGGRVLVAALGPARVRLAGSISLAVGLIAAWLSFQYGLQIAAVLFGSAALSSFFRMRRVAEAPPKQKVDQAALDQAMKAAKLALQHDAFDKASAFAHGVLTWSEDPAIRKEALETFLWARLGAGDSAGARALLIAANPGTVDDYLAAAVQHAAGHVSDAQRLLSSARSRGDNRVEIAALLVKVLLEQGKYPEAANLTQEIIEHSPPNEIRRVASEAMLGGAAMEAARLSLALARVDRSFDDAAQALFGFAKLGDRQQAVEAFKVALGFDRGKTQALLDDEALSSLRPELESAV